MFGQFVVPSEKNTLWWTGDVFQLRSIEIKVYIFFPKQLESQNVLASFERQINL